jgi:peroxiredoxin
VSGAPATPRRFRLPHEAPRGDAGRDTAGWTRPTPGRRRVIGVGFGVCAAVALVLTLKPAAAPGRGRIALGPGAGQPAPALRLPDLQGRDTRLSAFRGRPVALVFLATWCEGCRDEMPALARAAPALTRRGLVILGVDAVGETPAAVAAFVRAYRVPFRVLRDPSSDAMTAFAVAALPTTVVIGRDGRVALHREAAIHPLTLARVAFGHS